MHGYDRDMQRWRTTSTRRDIRFYGMVLYTIGVACLLAYALVRQLGDDGADAPLRLGHDSTLSRSASS